MTTQHPEALRLADDVDEVARTYPDMAEVSAELRRLHAENETLRTGYAAARLEIESLNSQLAAEPPAPSGEPVAWLSPWRADQVTTDYDAYGEHGIALYTAPQQEARPVTPYTCPKCHALWLHWPAEQSGFGMDTLNCRSTTHCDYCEKGGVEQLERLERVPAALKAPQQEAQESQEPFAWHVCSVNSDGSLSLEHAAAWEEAAHEHINDAITEHDIEGAGSWVVRPAYHAPQPSPAAQGDALDAGRWRRLVNASELSFPVATIADDPENGAVMLYGRKALEDFVDRMDEIPNTYDAARAAQEGKSHDN